MVKLLSLSNSLLIFILTLAISASNKNLLKVRCKRGSYSGWRDLIKFINQRFSTILNNILYIIKVFVIVRFMSSIFPFSNFFSLKKLETFVYLDFLLGCSSPSSLLSSTVSSSISFSRVTYNIVIYLLDIFYNNWLNVCVIFIVFHTSNADSNKCR